MATANMACTAEISILKKPATAFHASRQHAVKDILKSADSFLFLEAVNSTVVALTFTSTVTMRK